MFFYKYASNNEFLKILNNFWIRNFADWPEGYKDC